MIINHNLNTINTQRFTGISSEKSAKVMGKLASGLRIYRVGMMQLAWQYLKR